MQFTPCQGKDNCTEGGTHCDGCGRSHEEIARTRELIGQIAAFAQDMGYENVREFTSFIAEKAAGKFAYEQQQAQGGGLGIPVGIVR